MAATVFCTISAAVPPFLVGVLAVHMRDDFPFTSVLLAIVVAVYDAVSAAMSVPAGRIAHRYGTRRCLRGAALLAGISLGVLAVAAVHAVRRAADPEPFADGRLALGVQLGGAYGCEDLLVRLAAQIERARPWPFPVVFAA